MKRYRVHLKTDDIIEVSCEGFTLEEGLVKFRDRLNYIAVFPLSGICGFYESNEDD